MYLKPGLFEFEKWKLITWYCLSFVLFLVSNFFLFYLILPTACKFFISLETGPPSSFLLSSFPNIFEIVPWISSFLGIEYIFLQVKSWYIDLLFFLKEFLQDQPTLDNYSSLSFQKATEYPFSFLEKEKKESFDQIFSIDLEQFLSKNINSSSVSSLSSAELTHLEKASALYEVPSSYPDLSIGYEMQAGGLEIRLEAKIYPYLVFMLKTIFWSHLFFQIPILFLILLKMGLLKVDILKRNRKLAYICIIVLSGLISPPDLLSQLFFMIISLLFYELCIFLGLIDCFQ